MRIARAPIVEIALLLIAEAQADIFVRAGDAHVARRRGVFELGDLHVAREPLAHENLRALVHPVFARREDDPPGEERPRHDGGFRLHAGASHVEAVGVQSLVHQEGSSNVDAKKKRCLPIPNRMRISSTKREKSCAAPSISERSRRPTWIRDAGTPTTPGARSALDGLDDPVFGPGRPHVRPPPRRRMNLAPSGGGGCSRPTDRAPRLRMESPISIS